MGIVGTLGHHESQGYAPNVSPHIGIDQEEKKEIKMKTVEAVGLFLDNCQLRGLSVCTIKTYTQQLSYFAKVFPKLPSTPEDIEDFLASRGNGNTQETVHSYFRTLRASYNFLERRRGIANPMHKGQVQPPIVKPKVMPTLEATDINLLAIYSNSQRNDALWGLCRDDGTQNSEVGNLLRDNALIVLFIDTGIRSGEAISLKRDNIKEGYIVVEGKAGQRAVPISDFTRTLLLRLPKYDDGYVFHGHKGKLTRSGAYCIVKKALQQIGITGGKLGSHRLRHTFGRLWVARGGDIRSLQIILGHANITTTQKYTALAMSDVMDKHKEYSPAQLMGVK